MKNPEILQELKELLEYDNNSGIFMWKKKFSSRNKVGVPLGNEKDRYLAIRYKGKPYLLHKLAWYFVYGEYTENQIDHINQNTHDNRIDNLRIVTASENSKNKPKRRDNISGVTGVYFENYTKKWRACINHDGKNIRSKRFDTIDEAKQWRDSKAIEFGYSENHGKELSRLPYRKK